MVDDPDNDPILTQFIEQGNGTKEYLTRAAALLDEAKHREPKNYWNYFTRLVNVRVLRQQII